MKKLKKYKKLKSKLEKCNNKSKENKIDCKNSTKLTNNLKINTIKILKFLINFQNNI